MHCYPWRMLRHVVQVFICKVLSKFDIFRRNTTCKRTTTKTHISQNHLYSQHPVHISVIHSFIVTIQNSQKVFHILPETPPWVNWWADSAPQSNVSARRKILDRFALFFLAQTPTWTQTVLTAVSLCFPVVDERRVWTKRHSSTLEVGVTWMIF